MSEVMNMPPMPPHLDTAEKRRVFLLGFEEMLANQEHALFGDNDLCKLTHKFCDGMYVREIFIPAGVLLTGKIHKHEHPNFLLQGYASMITEDGGVEHVVAPMSIISPAGCKRAIYTHTDVRWVTVHLNPDDITDGDGLEAMIIAPSFEEYEKYLLEVK